MPRGRPSDSPIEGRHSGASAPLGRARFDAELRLSRGVSALVGVDEAGRGPLAGPVVAAAVVLPPLVPAALRGARDSKLLTPSRRQTFCSLIRRHALAVSVGWATVREIEQRNILKATLGAMARAVRRVHGRLGAINGAAPAAGADPSSLLVVVDGNRKIPDLSLAQLTVVGGDDASLSVACASIVAKVTRDGWMRALARRFPGYGFERHKGYGTPSHLQALRDLGPASVHRRTFLPVAAALGGVLNGARLPVDALADELAADELGADERNA